MSKHFILDAIRILSGCIGIIYLLQQLYRLFRFKEIPFAKMLRFPESGGIFNVNYFDPVVGTFMLFVKCYAVVMAILFFGFCVATTIYDAYLWFQSFGLE